MTFDVSLVVNVIAAVGAAAVLIGVAFCAMQIGILAWRWLRGSF